MFMFMFLCLGCRLGLCYLNLIDPALRGELAVAAESAAERDAEVVFVAASYTEPVSHV